MGEWPRVKIGSYARIQSGYSFKSVDWQVDGVPVVKIANVKSGRIARNGLGFVSPDVATQATRFALVAGDVVMAMTGYVGELAVVRKEDLPLLLNQRVGKCSPTSADLNKGFMYYALACPDARRQLQGLAQGSAQPNLAARDFGEVEVYLPPIAEQRAIAEVLGAFDDKIAVNGRVATSVREILGARFSSLASRVEWNVPLSEWVVLTKGVEPGRSNCNENATGSPFIRVGDLGQYGTTLWTTYPTSSVATEGDVLVAFDGTPGRVATGMSGVFSSGIRRVDIVRESLSPGICLALFDSPEVQQVIRDYSTGTTILHAGASIPHIKVPSFDSAAFRQLATEADQLFALLLSALRESYLLKQTRDALIPELLSGRLRACETDRVCMGSV